MNLQFFILFITVHLKLFSQNLSYENIKLRAAYYDGNGDLYKVEEQFENSTSKFFLKHGINNSVGVKRTVSGTEKSGTLKEEYFLVYEPPSLIDTILSAEFFTYSSNQTDDTLTIEYFDSEMNLIADTILTGEAALNYRNFKKNLRKYRLPNILKNKKNILLDSLSFSECIFVKFKKGFPINIKFFNPEGEQAILINGTLSKRKLIYNNYFTNDSNILYQLDTITWNKKMSKLNYTYNRLSWNFISSSNFQIDGNKVITQRDSIIEKSIYLNNKNRTKKLIIARKLYTDVFYFLQLRQFEREKPLLQTTNRGTIRFDYEYDNKGQIIRQRKIAENGELLRRIEFSYFN